MIIFVRVEVMTESNGIVARCFHAQISDDLETLRKSLNTFTFCANKEVVDAVEKQRRVGEDKESQDASRETSVEDGSE